MSIEIDNKCFGCGICEYICPTKAIELKQNEKGFIYPHIDRQICIECGKCDRVCVKSKNIKKEIPLDMFAIKNKDNDIRIKSTSGGVFYEIAKMVISNKGVVYGCLIDNENHVKHSRAECMESLDKFMGSKYVQSSLKEIFDLIKKDIREGKLVLFSGTPCQCASIKSMLENSGCNLEKFILCDFLCHGVPSASFFNDWIKFIESRYKGNVELYKFRDKERLKNPPDPRGIRFNIVQDDNVKDVYNLGINDLFFDMFLGNYILRESCYSCNFIGFERVSDFTLADYWGCDKHYLDFFDTKGISLLFINTQKGQELFRNIEDSFDYISVEEDKILQKPLVEPAKRREDYNKFWKLYLQEAPNKAFRYRENRIIKNKIVSKVKSFIKVFISKKLIKKLRK